ncbi:hypothetical protein IJ098_01555 [Candidatus Saccharibacteria bacterium]|nr:hypothetical protein [Candidatus Saccharibacteria bacterium]
MNRHNRKLIIAIIVIITIILLVIIGVLINSIVKMSADTTIDNYYSEDYDDISGQTTITSQLESEYGVTHLTLVGFSVFYDFGFSSRQQDEIYNTIYTYFSTNYPDYTTINFIKDSFSYNSDNFYQSSFRVSSNNGEIFSVSLDTEGSLDNIKIDITKISPHS